MRLVLLCIVKILGHIMLPPQFDFCDVTIFLNLLRIVHFCVHLFMMGFKQMSEEIWRMIVYLYDEGKSLRFIAEETGASRKGVQGVLKR